MARGNGCGRNRGGTAPQAVREEAVRVEEEMPMRRHTGWVGREMGCSCIEWQLFRISQMLDEQGRMLAELLQEGRKQ